MSKPYRPSNGTEGYYFIEKFCERCWWDRNENWSTLSASFNEGGTPEWVMDDDYTNARCTLFREIGRGAPKEMPADVPSQLKLFGGEA